MCSQGLKVGQGRPASHYLDSNYSDFVGSLKHYSSLTVCYFYFPQPDPAKDV
jgi:D-ribose pyranose/furanose isomerase RbsD